MPRTGSCARTSTRPGSRAPPSRVRAQWDNTALIEEILALRHEAAQLAGFASFAEYSLATKMARDPAEVLEFLRRLARLCRPAAQREFAELEAFAGTQARGLGRGVPLGAPQARAPGRLGRGAAAVLPACRACCRACSPWRSVSTACASRNARTSRCITPTSTSTTSSAATANLAAASSSTCTRDRRSAAAPGWTNAWGGSTWPARRRCRSLTSSATSPRRARTGLRC